MKLILYGILLHIIFLSSVFDIYFKSPISRNIPVQYNDINPPARRLVLLVADGLRADTFFSVNHGLISPHLRNIIERQGSWGVSHCRVPTESRPGHIAMIAGFYEDPSAVFAGWKDNVVEFDSLFNKSYVTYSWGSPDVLPMFQKGAEKNKVHTFCYDLEEDFSGQGSVYLNTWVFKKVEEFLESAKKDSVLNNSLRKHGVVFFLHLLGTDVAGHTNKPHSRKYRENVKIIDIGVKKIEHIFNNFYNNDNKTAFVYTSDHGMTDWGSHGAGSQSETEVPLVVWGAGAEPPHPQDIPYPQTLTPPDWQLSHLRRLDVAQADLTPLMAILIGVPIPVHSVGVVPLDYLTLGENDKAAALLLNARQLIAQLSSKRDSLEAKMIPSLYSPFTDLTREKQELFVQNIEAFIQKKQYDKAIEKTKLLIQLTHLGLDYYHSYFQWLLLLCVSLSFFGWIFWLLCQIMQQSGSTRRYNYNYSNKKRSVSIFPDMFFLLLAFLAIYLIYVQSLPIQFYLYCCLPLLLWWSVLRSWQTILVNNTIFSLKNLATVVMYMFLLELLVMTFFHRWVLSIVIATIGFWPLTLRDRKRLVPISLRLFWFTSSMVLAVFPSLPVIGSQTQLEFVIISCCLWLFVGWASLNFKALYSSRSVIIAQLFMLAIATAVVLFTSYNFENELGLQLLNQIPSWTLLVTSLAAPLTTSYQMLPRFLSIGLALAIPFLLLCVGHEAFFFLSLFVVQCVWINIEACLSRVHIMKMNFKESSEVKNMLSSDDFRKSFFFLLFIILSFFGTGNIASINSFDISWVRCFLTVFAPFTILVLVLLKTIIPFLLVTCTFRAINIFSEVKAEKMFMIVLIYCDIMGLHFLFFVTNKGSWLEIGTSVSHFVIMISTILFLAALYVVAKFYTSSQLIQKQLSTITIDHVPLWQKTHPD